MKNYFRTVLPFLCFIAVAHLTKKCLYMQSSTRDIESDRSPSQEVVRHKIHPPTGSDTTTGLEPTLTGDKIMLFKRILYSSLNIKYPHLLRYHLNRPSQIKELLEDEDFLAMVSECKELLGDAFFETMIKTYREVESQQYRAILTLIIGISDANAIDFLKNVLYKDTSVNGVAVASTAIALSGNTASLEILSNFYQNAESSPTRYLLRESLAFLGADAFPILFEAAEKEMPLEPAMVSHKGFFGLIDDPEAVPDFYFGLRSSENPNIQEMCAYGLLKNGGKEYVDEIIEVAMRAKDIGYQSQILSVFFELPNLGISLTERQSIMIETALLQIVNKTDSAHDYFMAMACNTGVKSDRIREILMDQLRKGSVKERFADSDHLGFNVTDGLNIQYLLMLGEKERAEEIYKKIAGLEGEEQEFFIRLARDMLKDYNEEALRSLFLDKLKDADCKPQMIPAMISALCNWHCNREEVLEAAKSAYFNLPKHMARLEVIGSLNNIGSPANNFLLSIMNNESHLLPRLAALVSILQIDENRRDQELLSIVEIPGREILRKLHYNKTIFSDPQLMDVIVRSGRGGLHKVSWLANAFGTFYTLVGKPDDIPLLQEFREELHRSRDQYMSCVRSIAGSQLDENICQAIDNITFKFGLKR